MKWSLKWLPSLRTNTESRRQQVSTNMVWIRPFHHIRMDQRLTIVLQTSSSHRRKSGNKRTDERKGRFEIIKSEIRHRNDEMREICGNILMNKRTKTRNWWRNIIYFVRWSDQRTNTTHNWQFTVAIFRSFFVSLLKRIRLDEMCADNKTTFTSRKK